MRDTLRQSVLRLLAPLVRLLLRHGVSHAEFAQWAKQVYVGEAHRHFGIDGRPSSASRIAIVTGVNRKEVRRVLEQDGPLESGTRRSNRAVRVVTGWLQDRRFRRDDGTPRALRYGEADASFNRLVRRHGGDVPARALLDELLRVGTVEERDGRLHLTGAGYVPRKSERALFELLGDSATDLLTTLEHNLGDASPPRLQMSVAYDHVTDAGVARFRALANRDALELLNRLDRALAPLDRDVVPSQSGAGRYRTGLGVYYIEERIDDESQS